MRRSTPLLALSVALSCALPAVAQAQATPVPQYSLPWGLRPAIAPTIVRSDTAFAFFDRGRSITTTLLGGYAFVPKTFGVYARGAYVHATPETGPNGGGFANPMLFALVTPKLTETLRLAGFAGLAMPFGQGGGNSPDLATRGALAGAVPARSSMDNALFAVNDVVPTVGVGLAHIADGLTLQVEATVLQLIRARGDQVQSDSSKTNFTTGVHAGYYVTSLLSVGGELRYQRWLSSPSFVRADLGNRDQWTAALGARANFAVAEGVIMRPGAALIMPLDDPMEDAGYKIVQLDIPVTF